MVMLDIKRDNFEKAYAALETMITVLQIQSIDPENALYWSAVMSVIKAFELCYETCWKYLKHALLEKHKIEALSPRMVFQLAAERGLIVREVSDALVKFITLRNETTHTYNPELARSVCAAIVEHAEVFRIVLDR